MKIAYLFPGQGTQSVGMGKEFYEAYPEAKKVYDKVEEITGIPIKEISFYGPEEELNKTKNTQLAVLTESLAILSILQKYNRKAEYFAGLSLGEYTALLADGILPWEEGIKLVCKRGELMQTKVPEGNWKMAAILGLDERTVEQICSKVTSGFVKPANFNTIGQIVLSGEEAGILEASELAKEMGAKKVSLLNTTGPFHTPKLVRAAQILKEEIQKMEIPKKDSRVVKNLDGELYSEKDDLAEILALHMISPVRFTKCLKTLYENGVDTFIEIGPRKKP